MHSIGPYILDEAIDKKSFRDIYKCKRASTGKKYACKIIDLSIKNDTKLLQNFKNELRIHAQMTHPGVIKLIDVMMDDDYIYLILDFFEPKTLEQIVHEKEGIDEIEASQYFRQIMEAIAYMHERGVAHRDITLKNILVDDKGNIKLSDFGLCKHIQETSFLTTTCGTFVYVPPEILREEQYNGLKADIWSAGITLYAMTSNHLPWIVDDSTPADKVWEETQTQICSGDIQYDDKQSELLRDLLSQMLSIDPEYRPDAEEILNHPWLAIAGDAEEPYVPEPNQNLINTVNSLIDSLGK